MTEMQEPTPDTLPASAEVAAVRVDPHGPAQAPVAADAPEAPAPMPRSAPRDPLDREEREIKDNVLRLGSLVADQITLAIQALEQHDADLALQVIMGDGRLNEAQRLITTLVARTIATQQPVARDLRFLLALDHVAYDLERMGDHASSVAKQARKLAPYPDGEANGRLAAMGRLTSSLTKEVLRALVDQDEALARQVAARDDEVDDLYHATFADMLELMRADPANVDRGARVLFAAHYLERIGDRVTNVAEDVVFLATGETEDLNP
jgi:phosphate transport system protein